MHPLPEYPRPSMRRDSYVNLNGPWDYAITQSSEFPAKWDGAILVPYSPEAKASGVGRTLQPGQWLHYHRTFTPPAGEGGRVLLHFGAVDYACAVEVNGRLAGGHWGGYWPFTLDITDLLRPQGHNTLWVAVQDPTGTGRGILAIAALKLGAAVAEGVDIDPVAVRTAGENAALNGVADKLTVLVGDLSDKASGKYDIITANIVANAIMSLAPAVPGLMADDAVFIASGIIDSRKDEVIAALEAAGLAVLEVKEKRGWECIVCKKA